MHSLLASRSTHEAKASNSHLLQLFAQLVALDSIEHTLDQSSRKFYRRIWCPVLTLWYLIWQRLHDDHALQAVITDARRGGADAFRPCDKKPLSQRIASSATTAYSKARQRLPLMWVTSCFGRLAQRLADLASVTPDPTDSLPMELLDGSTLRLRPHGDIPKMFPPHRTRRKKSYWCVARVVVSFCAQTGVALAAQIASIHQSEQALAVRQLLARTRRALHVGDRNFGVWRVARAGVQSGGQVLLRLTRARANKLAAGRRLQSGLDRAVSWEPGAHDQVDRGLKKEPVPGRLVAQRVHRRGFRPQTLFMFTTLTNTVDYPPQRLVELYGVRWQVELDFRTVKVTMDLHQLEVKSADMVQKEFYAGLMAYNLVRGLMALAAERTGCAPARLSFATARTHLLAALSVLWLGWVPKKRRAQQWEWLLAEVARARLPHRKKPRPSEPRKQWHAPQVFPRMQDTRAHERRKLKNQ
jgi:hypothetical protein